ncbi:hypothetical protein AURDEDRAFT_167561 [Auricularia subglabra TFB-10046 SS5]|nr:hypothetical protein AURDEDRAFT_167561 [Auricularia subglabra TFB-10046 SS5]
MSVLAVLRRTFTRSYQWVKNAMLGRAPSAYNIFRAWRYRRILENSPDMSLPELKKRIMAEYDDFRRLPKPVQRRCIRRLAREVGLSKRQRLRLALDPWFP